ncbi:MAG: hypothetical protein ACYCZV_15325 [Acidimicrobiales bacterium]
MVGSWLRGGHRFDLDNLVDPVLGAVGLPVAERASVWATVAVGATSGVAIATDVPPDPPADAIALHIAAPPTRSVRREERLAELAEAIALEGDGAVGCYLTLGADTRGLIFGFEGPIKPTIDALWPLLGGTARAPADHRIRDLRVRRDPEGRGIAVALWPM